MPYRIGDDHAVGGHQGEAGFDAVAQRLEIVLERCVGRVERPLERVARQLGQHQGPALQPALEVGLDHRLDAPVDKHPDDRHREKRDPQVTGEEFPEQTRAQDRHVHG